MNAKSYKMSIRLDPKTRDELRKRAEAERRDPSELVRLWILEKLEEKSQ